MSFLSIKDFSKEEILFLVKRALELKKGAHTQVEGKVANIFIEPSTRTLTSFQVAQDKMGIKRYDLHVENSSFKKGETLEDTLINLKAMGINNFVIRNKEESYWKDFKYSYNIINGGDGTKNHPSQALLDAITIYEHFGTLEKLKVLFVGDVNYSRVYHSNKDLLEKFDSIVHTLDSEKERRVKLEDCAHMYDVIVMLRIQHERHAKKMDIRGYNKEFGLNDNVVQKMKSNAIFMHPGPLNRNIEIDEKLLYDHPKNKILEQVTNGVFARMAILEKTCKNM